MPTATLLCPPVMGKPSARHTAFAGRDMVAIMNEALELSAGMMVLEVGAGSGYHAATIAEIVGPEGHVYAIEVVEDLVRFARGNLERAEYGDRVTLVQGDGSLGYPDRAPYHRIVVTAAAPRVPSPLIAQLKKDGILVIPVGGRFFPQELIRVHKKPDEEIEETKLGGVAFVPLRGERGFSD